VGEINIVIVGGRLVILREGGSTIIVIIVLREQIDIVPTIHRGSHVVLIGISVRASASRSIVIQSAHYGTYLNKML
jgi:hypothetical protein